MHADLRYAYLVGSLLFAPVWLVMYWRSPASRREMLLMSALVELDRGTIQSAGVASAAPASPSVDYAALAHFRLELRAFLHFSERAAHGAGIEPQQHQLLLALKGLPGPDQPPSVGNVASWLRIQHHSAVELVDRAAARGLVRREQDAQDRRRVLVHLTPTGDKLLDELSILHQQELQTNAPALLAALRRILEARP